MTHEIRRNLQCPFSPQFPASGEHPEQKASGLSLCPLGESLYRRLPPRLMPNARAQHGELRGLWLARPPAGRKQVIEYTKVRSAFSSPWTRVLMGFGLAM